MKAAKLFIIITVLLSMCCTRQSTTLVLPENCEFINYNDSSQIYGILNKPLKIVIWADSIGCTGCKLELDKWEYAIAELDSKFPDQLGYLFFLQFKDREDLEFLLGMDSIDDYYDSEDTYEQDDMEGLCFPLPVVWDPKGNFGKINGIKGYKCFIIDEDNNILFSGEPPFTTENKEKYVKVIEKYIMNSDYPNIK